MLGPRGQEAAVNVLEATIVASVMMASVAYVVAYDQPAPGAGGRAVVERAAADAVDVLYDTPVRGSAFGTNLMAVSTLECLQGDCARLEDKLEALLPRGARYAVYLTSGRGAQTVLEPFGPPPGEAVTARHGLEPQWSYTFLSPAQSSFSPLQDPVVLYGMPVFNSNALAPDGALSVTVRGVRLGDNASYVLKAAASTRAAASSQAGQTPAVSLYFADGAGAPLASHDARPQTLNATLDLTLATVPFRLRLEETAGVAVPAGAAVSVHLPPGWTAQASQAANPDWVVVGNATDADGSAAGSDVVAVLARAVSGEAVDLRFDATYRGDDVDYYPFRAALSGGASATASLLVRADSRGTLPSYDVPGVLLSVPRPMGAGVGQTTWTISALVPGSSGSTFSERVRVTRVEVAAESGAEVFGSVAGLQSAGGSWANEGDRLVWTGSVDLEHDSPLNLTFRATASGAAGAGVERAGLVPSLGLNNWSARLLDEPSPGLFRGAFLPAGGGSKGYNSSTSAKLYQAHPAESQAVYRSTALPGSTTYTVGYVASLRGSLFGSQVEVADRVVEPGGEARLSIDVQSVMYGLAGLGMRPDVTVKVYPPWSGDSRKPVHTEELFSSEAVLGAGTLASLLDVDDDGDPDRTTVGQFDVAVPVPASWLFGPYVVEVEATWQEDLSAIVEGVPKTATLARSARVYDYFVVAQPDGLVPASPVYDFHLVAWLPDW